MHDRSSIAMKSLIILTGLILVTSSFTMSSKEEISSATGNKTEEIRRSGGKETVADFRGVAKKAIPAVVAIKVKSGKKTSAFGNDSYQSDDPFDLFSFFGIPKSNARSQPTAGQASGVIVNAEGYILTNSHVVDGMDSIVVQLNDGREFNAKVLGNDSNSDLAVIKIEAQDLPYLTLGDSDDLEVGQWVAAVGNPFGLQGTLTAGVVSAKSRNNLDLARFEDFIQTDAAINRGNSGGPLLTLDGEIIGINTAIATNAGAGYIGIGFAIPSNMAKHVMDDIVSNGKVSRGLLGVTLQSLDYQLAQSFGLKKVEGALVTSVEKNSPASQAGLKVEDIILRFNDRPIENAASLSNFVARTHPGTSVKLTVLRQDQIIQVPIEVGDFSTVSTTASSKLGQLGIEVDALSPELAQKLGYTEDQGVVITRIDPSSAAALTGLKKGALILSINRQKVATVADYNRALAATPKDRPILLQVKQGERYLFVSLQVE
jgi:serine protease Do